MTNIGWAVFLLFTVISVPAASPQERVESEESIRRRQLMVESQIEARGISDKSVLNAMRAVPRHLFMPMEARRSAYADHATPIGEGQTISQPYIVAFMTETLNLRNSDRVLEIGTGSGYQAAVLAEIVAEVYSLEIKKILHSRSAATLENLGYSNVTTSHADGYHGWEEHAPFNAIMITAAVNHIPHPLLEQLVDGGRLILPLGDPYGYQQLVLVTKLGDRFRVEHVLGVRFVPMTGKALE